MFINDARFILPLPTSFPKPSTSHCIYDVTFEVSCCPHSTDTCLLPLKHSPCWAYEPLHHMSLHLVLQDPTSLCSVSFWLAYYKTPGLYNCSLMVGRLFWPPFNSPPSPQSCTICIGFSLSPENSECQLINKGPQSALLQGGKSTAISAATAHWFFGPKVLRLCQNVRPNCSLFHPIVKW